MNLDWKSPDDLIYANAEMLGASSVYLATELELMDGIGTDGCLWTGDSISILMIEGLS